jgi:glutamate racemase
VGGLTVLAALSRRLPAEDLLYLGDTARVPYGTRSPETIQRYSMRVAGHLLRRGIKALVVACNTATTWALPGLLTAGERVGLPVVGVIQPGVERALAASRSGHIGVLGTEATVRGGAYERALRAARPELRLSAQACPLFVSLAEEGWTEGPVPRLVAERYLLPLQGGPDAVILGCTHYPLLAGVIAEALPGVVLVDSATATAEATARRLREVGLLRPEGPRGQRRYLVTDNLERFREVGARFLGEPPAPIELVDISDEDEELARGSAP